MHWRELPAKLVCIVLQSVAGLLSKDKTMRRPADFPHQRSYFKTNWPWYCVC